MTESIHSPSFCSPTTFELAIHPMLTCQTFLGVLSQCHKFSITVKDQQIFEKNHRFGFAKTKNFNGFAQYLQSSQPFSSGSCEIQVQNE